jgi:hypothetical protein
MPRLGLYNWTWQQSAVATSLQPVPEKLTGLKKLSTGLLKERLVAYLIRYLRLTVAEHFTCKQQGRGTRQFHSKTCRAAAQVHGKLLHKMMHAMFW